MTGPYAVRMPDGRFGPDPRNVVHAKEIGTVLTACGMWTATWHRFWDVAFLAVGDLRRCPACLDALLVPVTREMPQLSDAPRPVTA